MADPEVKTAIVAELPDCYFCKMEGRTEPAEYDARTRTGQWGNMCEPHYQQHGVKPLGLGMGQKLILRGSVKLPAKVQSKADKLCERCGKGCPAECWNKETGRMRILDSPEKIELMIATGLYCEEVSF